MWLCSFCDIKNGSAQLSFNQIQFVEHLRNEHLQKFQLNRNIIYRCSYGHNGQCFTLKNDEKVLSEFNSEKEYGIHLVRVHLKESKLADSNNFSVSDRDCIENSRNYEIVRNPSSNAAQKWTPHHSAVNLPAALNDPNHRQLDIFSKTWGESFEKGEPSPCATLLSPTKLLFAPYIKQVRSSLLYRETMLRKIKAEKQQDISTGSNSQRTEIDNVPAVFFKSDFSLNCNEVFVSVLPIFPMSSASGGARFSQLTLLDNTLSQKHGGGSPHHPKGHRWVSDNGAHKLNEKLSHYLDIVEINIAKQVSKKSTSFFEAVSTQDKVQDKIKSALGLIAVVREKLRLSDTKLTRDHLQVLIYAQRKKNMQTLLRQLRVIKTVHSAQSTIQTLLASNDFCGVLDLIAGTQNIMKVELFSSRSSDCSPILCLKHVWAQLVEMKTFVEKMVQQEFLNTVSSQLRLEDDWRRPGKEVEVDYSMVPSLLAMLRIVVYNSALSSNLNQFVQLYFDDAMELLKSVVKSRVLQAYSRCCERVPVSDETDEEPMGLADQMRALDFEQWLGLMAEVCDDAQQLLFKVQVGCHTMIDTLQSHLDEGGLRLRGDGLVLACPSSDIISSDAARRLRTDTVQEIQRLPGNMAETVEQRMVKLVRARAKDGYLERLTPSQMVRLHQLLAGLCRGLGDAVTRSSAGPGASQLTCCVAGHAARLVTRFHNEHREKLLLILDSDLWKAAEVPSQLQELASHISGQAGLSLPVRNGHGTPSDAPSSRQSLQLDHQQFTVVAAALMLFQMIVEYCQCASDLRLLPAVPEQVLGHLLALLDSFNSRCCQLVLGARARQLVDLETITARNLALAARSLQLVLALTPRVSVHFLGLSASVPPPLFASLHDLERRLEDHVARINNKLVSMMEERIRARMASWSGRPPSPSSETRAICQQLARLHEALSDVYPPAGGTDLLLQVHNVFKSSLRARLREVNIAMDNGPQHGLVKLEVAYYMSQLNGFGGLQKFSDNFADIWR